MDPFHGLSAREWREVVRRATRQYEQEHGFGVPESGIPEGYLHQAAQEVRAQRLSWRSTPVLVGGWLLCAGLLVSLAHATSAKFGCPATTCQAETVFACPVEDVGGAPCPFVEDEAEEFEEPVRCFEFSPSHSVPRPHFVHPVPPPLAGVRFEPLFQRPVAPIQCEPSPATRDE